MVYLPPLHLGVVAIEKESLGSPSTKVANFTFYLIIYIKQYDFCKPTLFDIWAPQVL